MSVSPVHVRPTNDIRDYQLYWCYRCHRTVRITSENPPQIICPRCFGQFLDEMTVTRPRLVDFFTEYNPSPEARILEALTLMLDPQMGWPIHDFNPRENQLPNTARGRFLPWRRRNRGLEEADDWAPESGILARPRSWIILRPAGPMPDDPDGPIENLIPPRVDPGNYFVGPGLEALIEELTQNDREGPPPAPDSTINALPIVKISEAHLMNDWHRCPVCMEEFKVGGEAREMPCNHIYHSDCILPWLRLHNSCPVCRLELPVPLDGGGDGDSVTIEDLVNGGVRDRNRRRCSRWMQLVASLWPTRSRYRPLNSRTNNISSSRRAHSDGFGKYQTILWSTHFMNVANGATSSIIVVD